ncbi:antibiotic biosynthesis monooxygenase [bacterium]|nr:antibiotic biosynthesis monooxygenase [bacterium]
MFTIIYSFQVKPGEATPFEKAWRDLTVLIYENEGSLGSRLHKQADLSYIAYAQWPDRDTWKNSGSKMPEKSKDISKAMKASCEKVETLYELEVVDDLLVTNRD